MNDLIIKIVVSLFLMGSISMLTVMFCGDVFGNNYHKYIFRISIIVTILSLMLTILGVIWL